MNKSILKKSMLMKIFDKSLVTLPTPLNISMFWNFGSMLGVMLMIQIITGLLLSLHYCPNIGMAFNSIIHIMQDVNSGWLIRNIHMNGASMFFFLIYMHIGRSMYYSSYSLSFTWLFGTLILFSSMMTAFLGYILPWGQMSFWGATVITNLISVIPYFGNSIVFWLWGGFSINNATLNRFYSFHFILPFLILMLVIIHLMYLHQSGSSNPLGSKSDLYKIPFHNYFFFKDILGFIMMLMILLMLVFNQPYMLSDPDNFIPASSLNTPIHIQPEWYFLFAYAILRSIPNKLGGVIALIFSIMILWIMPLNYFKKIKSFMFFPINQFLFWMFCCSFCILTWVGSNPVNFPYITISQITSLFYFSYFFWSPLIMKMWKIILFK